VPVAGHGLTVKHRGVHGPRDVAEPGHPGVDEKLAPRSAVAMPSAAFVDMDLRSLAIELWLSDVASIREPSRVAQA
jgi:hypothetical protein